MHVRQRARLLLTLFELVVGKHHRHLEPLLAFPLRLAVELNSERLGNSPAHHWRQHRVAKVRAVQRERDEEHSVLCRLLAQRRRLRLCQPALNPPEQLLVHRHVLHITQGGERRQGKVSISTTDRER